jgi:CsoR family transcriptional regulator, copper-sensing transcriptional repressor
MRTDDKKISHRLKIISGQLAGLEKMIEEDKYCVDIVMQSLAIQSALREIDKAIVDGHIKTCVVEQIRKGETEKATEELAKIYSLYKKNG